MRRKLILAVLLAGMALPGGAGAFVDTSCSNGNVTSAVTGFVRDADNNAQGDITVRIYATHFSTPSGEDFTDHGTGFYRVCNSHNTWIVQAQDLRTPPYYAETSQPITTFTNYDRLDFTPASGYPLKYMGNLVVSPPAINTTAAPASSRTFTFTYRTKMGFPDLAYPARHVRLTTNHGQFAMVPRPASEGGPTENGGPASSGWNVWWHQLVIPQFAGEGAFIARAVAYKDSSNTVEVAQLGQVNYYMDSGAPQFGASCGLEVNEGFKPPTASGTTNPQATVKIGVCDKTTNGSPPSGLDPYSLSAKICPSTSDCTPGTTCPTAANCQAITPHILGGKSIQWLPPTPLPLGDSYYFRYSIRDRAGNLGVTPTAFQLRVVSRGGAPIVLLAQTPNDLGTGNNSGIIAGCSCTQPSSVPTISFRINDDDGPADVDLGTIRVRVYYMEERTTILGETPARGLVYDYDPRANAAAGDQNAGTVSPAGDAWIFTATGMSLVCQLPGRYIAVATATDRGGNSDTLGWHWVLAGAAANGCL